MAAARPEGTGRNEKPAAISRAGVIVQHLLMALVYFRPFVKRKCAANTFNPQTR
jgi:hypothetical protein